MKILQKIKNSKVKLLKETQKREISANGNKANLNKDNIKNKKIKKKKSQKNIVNNKSVKTAFNSQNAKKIYYVSLPKPAPNISNEINSTEQKEKFVNKKKSGQKETQQHSSDTSLLPNKNASKKAKKRKSNNSIEPVQENIDISNCDADVLNEVIISVKRKKINEQLQNDDQEDLLFQENITLETSPFVNNQSSPKSSKLTKSNKKSKKVKAETNNVMSSEIKESKKSKFSEKDNENDGKHKKVFVTSEVLTNDVMSRELKTSKKKKKRINKKDTANDGKEKNVTSDVETNNLISNKLKANKKMKASQKVKDEGIEKIVINNVEKKNIVKFDAKKEQIRKLLQNKSMSNLNEKMIRSPAKINAEKGQKLRERMLERLKSAQFRYLNEKLYTSSGTEAHQLFQSDPAAFKTYHEGYQQQLKKWPVNPLDLIVQRIQKMPKSHKIADMGCGEAALSRRIQNPVRSFDLVSSAPGVEVCDMSHTPLLSASMDVAVYCLALMGTELTQYLVEANRVLKVGGHLLIAEVESRFEKVEDFTKEVERLGFKLKKLDKSHTVFFFMEFTKVRDPPAKKSKLPVLTLKPCLYKKR